MAKLILFSCVLAVLVIPILASRRADPRRGLQWALILMVVYNLLYVFLVRYIYPRLVG